ncbi:hypothetical protein ABZ547_41525 [Streptomyces sparsogenes]|uniref:hypothetical protein n=1 Tax=Streptomyces sparsogenes TaxID=67365 RepID=UPI0033F6D2A5
MPVSCPTPARTPPRAPDHTRRSNIVRQTWEPALAVNGLTNSGAQTAAGTTAEGGARVYAVGSGTWTFTSVYRPGGGGGA